VGQEQRISQTGAIQVSNNDNLEDSGRIRCENCKEVVIVGPILVATKSGKVFCEECFEEIKNPDRVYPYQTFGDALNFLMIPAIRFRNPIADFPEVPFDREKMDLIIEQLKGAELREGFDDWKDGEIPPGEERGYYGFSQTFLSGKPLSWPTPKPLESLGFSWWRKFLPMLELMFPKSEGETVDYKDVYNFMYILYGFGFSLDSILTLNGNQILKIVKSNFEQVPGILASIGDQSKPFAFPEPPE
jgi:hypothetical protein